MKKTFYKDFFYSAWYYFSFMIIISLLNVIFFKDNKIDFIKDFNVKLFDNFFIIDNEMMNYLLLVLFLIIFIVSLVGKFFNGKGSFLFLTIFSGVLIPYNIWYMIKNKFY